LFFPIAEGTLPWQPILALKLTESAYSPLFVAMAFQKTDCNIALPILKSSPVMIWLRQTNRRTHQGHS